MTTILVIDDEPGLDLVKELATSGVSVASVSHGQEVLREYFVAKPNLVVINVTLPDMNGIDDALRLREFDRTLPILLTSDGVPLALLDASGPSDASYGTTFDGTASLAAAIEACLRKSSRSPAARFPAHRRYGFACAMA